MADKPKDPNAIPELTEVVLKEFQALTDPKERKAYYDSHPELGRLYSQGNFHVA